MKTKRALAKRVKVTGTGKLKRMHAYGITFSTKKNTQTKETFKKSRIRFS